ncbi:MAG TPA: ECF-type sigma factor [Gemmataceae bacterium]|nr:ECF-type sigma factor [Gemmataceae bacterium]
MADVTQILSAMERGEPQAAEQLLPLVYDELRRLAAAKLAGEAPGHTLEPTALVHEAYLRLVPAKPQAAGFANRGHFFAAAAEAMRRILVENARRKKRLKRGGNLERAELLQPEAPAETPPEDLLALDEALNQLAEEDPVKAELVKLRFFAGLTSEEAADCLGVSRATAARYWTYARAWLYARLRPG